MAKKNRSGKFWCALVLFSLIGQIAWVIENMYFNVFIYKMFHASAADISAMVAASAVSATLTTVLMGALSDRVGKRKLFISLGYILWGISILGFSLLRLDVLEKIIPMTMSASAVGISLVIVMDCIMTFFGSTANDAAFNAWLTDSTDHTNRGAAEGINSMMPLLAILVVFGGFMFFDLSLPESWTAIFLTIGGIVLISGILGMVLISEPAVTPSKEGYWSGVFYGFRPSTIKNNRRLYLALAAFILFNISIQIFMPYLILYYEVSLQLTDYIFIMAPAIVIAAIVTAFWGRVYDKKGFTASGLPAVLSLIAGYLLLYFFTNTVLVFLGSLLMMCGYLSGMAVFGAIIRDHTPQGKAGMLQGVRIFSQVLIPGLIGPYLGKTVLANAKTVVNNDGTTSFVPNANIFLAAFIVALLVLPCFLLFKHKKKPRLVALKTPFEETLTKEEIPFSEYPRPQMKRNSYLCLNGEWQFCVFAGEEKRYSGKITVPFPPESRLSGVERKIQKDETLRYSRSFSLPDGFLKERVLLHFGAVDQTAEVAVNGTVLQTHEDGYLPFSVDITDALQQGENLLTVYVKDPLDIQLPYGKQSIKRGGMWYTKTSGIWQTVWLESVPNNAIQSLKITPNLHSVTIEVQGGQEQKNLTVQLPQGEQTVSFVGNSVTFEVPNPILWTPEQPHLYPFVLTSGEDCVESYFALRTVCVQTMHGKPKLCLNGQPYFFHGVLDQGYFSDGIYLPATVEGFRSDILNMKACGFNMLRKHIKLEPDLFYYECDRLGMVVFQDLINSGKYHFFIDTALPTVGLKRGISHKASPRRRKVFEKAAQGMLAGLYNHPCVCYYTIFNEGWGQFDADDWYVKLKNLDPTRVFDSTSGWFWETLSDVHSEHIYFKPIRLKEHAHRPIVLSEFGGYSCKIKGHAFNLDKTYGYRFFENTQDFRQALLKLYEAEVIPALECGLCATVLTQVSDVEDETNGLLTYDRAVLKVDAEQMKQLSEKIKQKFVQINSSEAEGIG